MVTLVLLRSSSVLRPPPFVVLQGVGRASIIHQVGLPNTCPSELSRVVGAGDPYGYIIPAATLACLVGLFLLLAGILRLGFIANFISTPVLTGFKAGIGVVIFVGQLGKVSGLPLEKGPVLQTILALLQNLDQIHWLTLALSLVTLAILIFLPRLTKRVPAAQVAVALGILLSGLLGLEALGVALVGAIPAGLPSLTLPDLSLIQAL